jgi:threonine/homoserine efflux transporter RhtA
VLFPFLVPSSAYKQFFQTSIRGWLLLAFLTFLTFIIPVYCNQKGIQQVEVEKHAIIIASCPIFAYILSQIFIKDQLLPFPKLLLILAISTSAGLALSLLPGKRPISK